METVENNKLIAEFIGLYFYAQIEVSGYSDTMEPYSINERINAWSNFEKLEFKESDCPAHWNAPDVVNEWKTPLIRDLKYHSDWNWLMGVVEKIQSQPAIIFEFSISMAPMCRIMYVPKKTESKMIVEEGGEPIECVYKAVIRFIKWHNTQSLTA